VVGRAVLKGIRGRGRFGEEPSRVGIAGLFDCATPHVGPLQYSDLNVQHLSSLVICVYNFRSTPSPGISWITAID
jgi:hypothetical protein